jgi:hypothetical protein
MKDNHYPTPLYCRGNPLCTPVAGEFYITQMDADLNVEWKFKNTTFDPDTGATGYEWCVNAPAVDSSGIVLATAEDGMLYSIPQGQTGVFTTPRQSLFLLQALGAAYTPVAFGPDGKIYTQNGGHLFVVGN